MRALNTARLSCTIVLQSCAMLHSKARRSVGAAGRVYLATLAAYLTADFIAPTGRAVSGMMVVVAVATLGGPAVASSIDGPLGWRATSLLLGVVPAVGAAFLCVSLPSVAAAARGGLRATPALVAGWACSTLVLAAYWTLLTRWQS